MNAAGTTLYLEILNCLFYLDDTSVTAAVVLSCIAVFSVILIAVIVYMRRKRRSTL